MKILEVVDLKKSIGSFVIFENITFSVDVNEIMILLGDSGSGKTTLLNCLSLLEKKDSGEINYIGDIEDDFRNKKSKNIGIVFQDFNLWPHLTVLQNLILAPIKVNKESKKYATKRAYTLLKKLEIEGKINSIPSNLSGGQKQRVAIARALMMKPKIMLFDEPTSALDPSSASKVINILQSLKKEGITIIIATHEINFAEKIGDRFIFLYNKVIKEKGDIAELKKPKTTELRKFLNLECPY